MEVRGKKILVADDEPDIVQLIEFNLAKDGYEVFTAKDGNDAIEKVKKYQPDLVVLDVMMPGKTGMEVCEYLRSQPEYQNILIIFLTALSDENSHIKGLELGADDYISKPISQKILLSRVNALFRRTKVDEGPIYKIGNITIDPSRLVVNVNDKEDVLAKKEFELLHLLASKPGKVFVRNEILNRVWGSEVIVGDRTIDVHVRKIRQKMDVDCITTVKGVGYKFEAC